MDGKLCSSGEGGTDGKDLQHVCVAPPMIVGVWSMAVMLWQLLEYYYYYEIQAPTKMDRLLVARMDGSVALVTSLGRARVRATAGTSRVRHTYIE